MALLDKLDEITKTVGDKVGEIAKTVSDKTGDMVELGKLSGKIRTEEGNIAALKARLGEHFYQRFEAGEIYEDEAGEICAAILSSYAAIETARDEMAKIKGLFQHIDRQRIAVTLDKAFCVLITGIPVIQLL